MTARLVSLFLLGFPVLLCGCVQDGGVESFDIYAYEWTTNGTWEHHQPDGQLSIFAISPDGEDGCFTGTFRIIESNGRRWETAPGIGCPRDVPSLDFGTPLDLISEGDVGWPERSGEIAGEISFQDRAFEISLDLALRDRIGEVIPIPEGATSRELATTTDDYRRAYVISGEFDCDAVVNSGCTGLWKLHLEAEQTAEQVLYQSD